MGFTATIPQIIQNGGDLRKNKHQNHKELNRLSDQGQKWMTDIQTDARNISTSHTCNFPSDSTISGVPSTCNLCWHSIFASGMWPTLTWGAMHPESEDSTVSSCSSSSPCLKDLSSNQLDIALLVSGSVKRPQNRVCGIKSGVGEWVGWLVGALSPVNHKGLHQGWTQTLL